MWSGLKCSAGSWAASLSWTMTLQFGNESRGKHFLTPEKKKYKSNKCLPQWFCLNSILVESGRPSGHKWVRACSCVLRHVHVCVCMCVHTARQMSLSVCGAGLSLVAGRWQCSDWADFTEDVRGNLKAALGLRCLSPPRTLTRTCAHARARIRTRAHTHRDVRTATFYSRLYRHTRTYRCMDRRMKPETWTSAHLGDTHMYVLTCTLSLLLYYKVNYRNLLRECCTIPSVCLTTQC